jgi:hypothetical protein
VQRSTLTGGAPGSSNFYAGMPGYGVAGSGSLVTPECVLNGGLGPGAAAIGALPAVLSSGHAPLGGTAAITLTGLPGSALLLVADVQPGHLVVPAFVGPYLLTPVAVPLSGVPIGPGGSTTLTFAVPALAALANSSLYFQGAAVGSTPSFTTLGDLRLR